MDGVNIQNIFFEWHMFLTQKFYYLRVIIQKDDIEIERIRA